MRLIPCLVPVALAALALPLTACGGGGGGDATTTVVLALAPAYSGSMSSTGEYGDTAIDGTVVVGDDFVYGSDYETRGFIGFDVSSIPSGAVITTAILRLAGRIYTGNPYGLLGAPIVDHVIRGPTIAAGDFSSTLTANVAAFPTFTSSPDYQAGVIPVTDPVRNDRAAARSISTFRLRFATGAAYNSLDDGIRIQVSQVDANLRPTLEVTYR